MKCDEVKKYLSDYFDNKLSRELRDEVQKHLDDCKECNNEFQLLNNFLLQASHLETGIEPPKEIVDGISEQLIKLSSKSGEGEKAFNTAQLNEIKKALHQEYVKTGRDAVHKNDKTHHSKPLITLHYKNLLWLPFFAVLFFCVYMVYDYSKYNAPWKIKLDEGNYAINGIETNATELNEEDILSTKRYSRVRFNIPKVGYTILDENSEIVFIKGKDDDNILKLTRGKMLSESEHFQPGLTLQTDLAVIKDLGSKFSVSYENGSVEQIEVSNGYVEVRKGDEVITLSGNHICIVTVAGGIGIPFHKTASLLFREALIEFESGANQIGAFDILMAEATEYDALTLLSVLQRVGPNDRRIVLDHLIRYFPLAGGITADGLLSLNEEMIQLYWDDIEWQL